LRISISNIAWDRSEDEAVAELMRRYNVDALDIAPAKYFSTPGDVPTTDIMAVRTWWAERGIEITGMQSLLFGTTGLNVFGAEQAQSSMLRHLHGICHVAAVLGCTRLVFGSPRNRDRGAANDEDANAVAVPFFQRLGEIAAAMGVVICLEPNPPCYGANFLTTATETASFVRQVGTPSIRMQLDTGALTISGETPCSVLGEHRDLIGHIHVSEPHLVPIGDGGCDHSEMAHSLREHMGEPLVAIEMLATNTEPHLVAIERALRVAVQHYRGGRPAKGQS
jgi:D-psicose/D-tagatose/L-ribulose 3-epimerase